MTRWCSSTRGTGNGQRFAEWYEEVLGLPRRFGDDHWIEFAVDGDAAIRDLDAKGVALYPEAERTIFDVGPTRVATFRDPDGNWRQLAERKAG